MLGFYNQSYGPMRERIVAVVLNGTYVISFHRLTEDDSSVYTFYVKDFRNVACGNNVEMNLTVVDKGKQNCLVKIFITSPKKSLNQPDQQLISLATVKKLQAFLFTCFI